MSLNPAALLLEQFDPLLTTPKAVEELNRAILTLAVKGKLVEQDPQDEPASRLVQRLHNDKQLLLNNRRTSKEFSEISLDSKKIPFVLPNSWEWVAVNDVCYLERGITFPSSAKEDIPTFENIVCLRTSNVQNEVDWNDLIYVDRKFIPNDNKIIQPNDVLISMANSYELVGKVSLVDEVAVESTFGGFISVIRCYNGVLPKYLLYVFRSAAIQDIIRSTASQTTNIANISLGKIYPLPFPLPPLAEQKRIVARVEALFAQTRQLAERLARAQHDLARLNQAALVHLLAAETPEDFARQWTFLAQNFDSLFTEPEHIAPLRQAILQLAVQGKLVPQDPNDEPANQLLERINGEKEVLLLTGQISRDPLLPPIREEEIPFDLPQGWEWVKTGHIGKVMGGLTKNSTRATFPLKMPYLRVANVYANELRLDDIQQIGIQENELDRVSLLKGDMLVVEGNGSIEQIGRVAIWDGSIDPCLHQNHIIKVRFNPVQIAEYVVYWLLSPGGREQITKVASTTTGLHTLSLSKVSALPIPLPPPHRTKTHCCQSGATAGPV